MWSDGLMAKTRGGGEARLAFVHSLVITSVWYKCAFGFNSNIIFLCFG